MTGDEAASHDENREHVRVIAELARQHELSVAAAESLTCGALSSSLGKGEEASSWLAGGVVAYDAEVKFRVLGVEEGPVVTASCARQMAVGVQRLLQSDVAIAVTGVGGPDPEEGKAPGTVFIATLIRGGLRVEQRSFSGQPPEILSRTVVAALGQAARHLRAVVGSPQMMTARPGDRAP